MAININSEAFCRKAFLNYHCYGNTMGLTAEEMGKITNAWQNRIESWKATVSSDENEYEFDDSEYANYKDKGEDKAQKATNGYDGKNSCGAEILSTAGAAGATFAATNNIAGNAIVKIVTDKAVDKAIEVATAEAIKNGTIKAGESLSEEAIKMATQKATKETAKKLGSKFLGKKASEKIAATAAKEGAEAAAKETTKQVAKTLSAYVAAGFAIAAAAKYRIKKPNKEDVNAAKALESEMTNAQITLSESQNYMGEMSDEIINLSDEALALNEDANDEIKDQKTEYDAYLETFLALKEKAESGTPLSDSEKELYKAVVGYLTKIGVLIEETADDTSDEVGELYDEIGTYQDGYDATAETMGEVEGLTDFAEGFDKATKKQCLWEAGAQSLNAVSAFKAAARLFAGPWWNWVIAGLASAAGVSSGFAAKEQIQWSNEVSREIEFREIAQTVNTETMDMYTEEIDAYDGFLQGVDELELEIPDDIAPPEDTEIPDAGKEATGADAVPEVLRPKKKDEAEENK